MFIIFGTRGLKHTVKEGDTLYNSCPNCQQGNLVSKLYRRWFTLFFIPVIPLDVIDRFYECDKCSGAYNENVKSVLQHSKEDMEKEQQEAQRVYAIALIATMTHMSIIDGEFAPEEEREIMDNMAKFPQFETVLNETFTKVKNYGNKDNQVFSLLNDARNKLSSESLINLLAQAAVVLLADGKIEKEEENLMKEYLIACGLPKDMYYTLIEKLRARPLTEFGKEQMN
ncbi:TerB family tellurite resistance protein [Abyssalbus ytuae]|uniref:TerB family tellurite resistance protein n=1 Tax=Abyssalbus ytuae TaxID=2926907 RepID=A0A9E7CU35_9FLAO|nr:TerB family tellurite resistance protein [Abyssalbus ytuae]UOB19331.1 TerB family tellurite resistance protein [Abyssalbus ytuae]